MKIYVMNHPEGAGIERRIYMQESLSKANLEFEFIDGYHPKDFDYDNLIKNYEIVNVRLNRKVSGLYFEPIYVNSTNQGSYVTIPTKIGKGAMSLYLKTKHCFYDQIFNKYDYVAIFEDDCEIPENLSEIISKSVREMKEFGYDIAFLGGIPDSPDLVSKNYTPGRTLHYHPDQKCRCTHGYITSLETSKIFLENMGIINNALDIRMNEIMQIFNLKVAWYEPALKQIFNNNESLINLVGR